MINSVNFFSQKYDHLKALGHKLEINTRKFRNKILGFKTNGFFVKSGDFLEVFFFLNGALYSFEGVCLSISRKNFFLPDVGLVLRNKIQNVWIECCFSYFYNRLYCLRIHDYKRKFFSFNKSKLFFLKKVGIKKKKNNKYSWYLSRTY